MKYGYGHMYYAGIDIGSTMTKVVLIDEGQNLLSVIKGPTGPEHRKLADNVIKNTLLEADLDLSDITCIVATGYGRFNVPFADRQITEITCHAAGVSHLFPNVKTAIDIGGQDVKCMRITCGKLVDFVLNDKCAAGTGRFLEVTAAALEVRIEDLGKLSLRSTKEVKISNLCTIFAQQEVVSLLSEEEKLEDIINGLHYALASRIIELARRIKIEQDFVVTGGVALNTGAIKAISRLAACETLVPQDPLITGALGAALKAQEFTRDMKTKGESAAKKDRQLDKATFFYGNT